MLLHSTANISLNLNKDTWCITSTTELLLQRGNDIDRQSSPMHHIQTGMETIECEQLTCMLCNFILTFTVLCFMVHGEAL